MTCIQKVVGLIERRGTTQGEVEVAVKLPQGRISKWIAGQGEPRLGQAMRLARWFGVTVEWLADDTLDEMPPEAASGDLRTVTAVIVQLGAKESLRRLLLSTEGDG